jgi:hypothetical protein
MSTEPVPKPRITWTTVWLLFPFITNQAGFDTGITIANISLDPFGTKPDEGSATLHFYGDRAPEPKHTGTITPGTVWANALQNIAPGFQGYLIAQCNFNPARGLAVIQRVGGLDAAPYLAEILRVDVPALEPEIAK